MRNINSAIITPVLAAGSTASPYIFSVNITQKLCSPACAGNPPVFSPQFSLESLSSQGSDVYQATIRVQGLISYVPCGKNECCARTQPLSQTFTIPFVSATAPTSVVVAKVGESVCAIHTAGCQSCGSTLACDTPISLTIETA